MFHFGRLILFSLISTFGTASITANAIGNTMGNFHVFAGQAICMGLTTVVSQCVGAGAYDRARYYMKKADRCDLCGHGVYQHHADPLHPAHSARVRRRARSGSAGP